MRKILLALAMMCTPAEADISDWDTKTKLQFGITTTLIVSDFISTSYALRNTNAVETNPLFGKRPSDETLAIAAALSIYGNYYAFEHLNEKERFWYFIGVTVLRGYAINNNISIGAKFEF